MRPIIGVTSEPKSTKGSSGDLESHVIGHTYTDAVLRAGGTPVVLAPVPNADVGDLIERLDGLVLTGGGDVEPSRYAEQRHESVWGTNSNRDEFEIALVLEAKVRRLPTPAICL